MANDETSHEGDGLFAAMAGSSYEVAKLLAQFQRDTKDRADGVSIRSARRNIGKNPEPLAAPPAKNGWTCKRTDGGSLTGLTQRAPQNNRRKMKYPWVGVSRFVGWGWWIGGCAGCEVRTVRSPEITGRGAFGSAVGVYGLHCPPTHSNFGNH